MPKLYELQWTPEERRDLEKRILSLMRDQIAALPSLIGIEFSLNDMKHTVEEIMEKKHHSIHLETFISEAHSKEKLLW